MPRWLPLGRHLGNPRTEAGVCATLVVMSHPLPENESPNAVHSGGSANPNTLDGLYRSVARRTRSLAGTAPAFSAPSDHRDDRAIHGRRIDAVAIVRDGPSAFRGLCGSPDGRFFAYLGSGPPPERSGPAPQEKLAVWVGSLAGGEPREIWRPAHDELSAYSSLAWDARGGGLFVGVRTKSVRELPRADQIWYVPIDGGEPHATGIAMPGVAISDVHPAGRRIGFTSSVNAAGR